MEGVKCVGGEGWMWVVGACLCFYSVQVFAHVHCMCVHCVCFVCVVCVLCVLCVLCVRVRVCVCMCVHMCCVCMCVLCGVNVCGERGGGVWKE